MRTIIIDDDRLVVMSLKTILEADGSVEVAGIGYDGKDAERLYHEHQPDVVLMDIQMKGMDGITAAEGLLRSYSEAKILFLTTFSDDEYILRALEAGGKGYILKQDFQGIVPALIAVEQGQSVFGGEIVGRLTDIARPRQEYDYRAHGISEKEQEIIAAVAAGASNREIAGRLCLSEGTVRNYISTILSKLELRDRTQLAVFYLTKI